MPRRSPLGVRGLGRTAIGAAACLLACGLLAAPGRAVASPCVLGGVCDLAELLCVDDRTVRRWRSEGKLPPAIELGGSVVRWRAEVVERWLREREA